jgi:hypothetical protein
MSTPEQPTSQIEHKYTHEVVISERGKYKYDKVIWQQDFKGWQARHSKDWQQDDYFNEVPSVRFKPYDEMRVSLADEVLTNIEDAMAQKIPFLLKRLDEDDVALLTDIRMHGPIPDDGPRRERYTESILKCKARQLVVSTKRENTKGTYHLDITNLGLDVLTEHDKEQSKDDK